MPPLSTIVWIYGSSDPANPAQLELIRQWWAGLNGQLVTWRQRLFDGGRAGRDLDWTVERFDEEFWIDRPELRGITLFWYKSGTDLERSSTPQRLELDQVRQQLYIYPQSQPDVAIRVGLPEVAYSTIALNDPSTTVAVGGGRCVLTLTDPVAQVVVEVALSAEALYALKRQLP